LDQASFVGSNIRILDILSRQRHYVLSGYFLINQNIVNQLFGFFSNEIADKNRVCKTGLMSRISLAAGSTLASEIK
jgi:hypothetical protein